MNKTVLVLAIILLIVCGMVNRIGCAEDEEMMTYYILVNPTEQVNVRTRPNIHSKIGGYAMCGWDISVEYIKNGWAYCPDMVDGVGGYISAAYLCESQPEIYEKPADGKIVANGRVALRKNIGGKRVRWLKPGEKVQVIARSCDWCLIDGGYVMTEFVENAQ